MLSISAVRALMIAAQGLHSQPPHQATKQDVLKIIRQMHVLQIDTIHVVARSPYLVLWSRLGSYNPRWLEELLAEGRIFEYWSHAACFLPIEDYPLYRRLMLDKQWGRTDEWLDNHTSLVEAVMQQIQMNGAVRSSDFKRTDGQAGAWWNWKDEKIALELLFNKGELMIAKRHNFQRIYDLRKRILPDWDDTQAPPYETVVDTFTLHTVKALGVTKAGWVADYFRMPKADILRALKRLEADGRLLTVKVEGWNEPGYFHPDHTAMIGAAAQGELPLSRTTLLSPFDPLVWDRTRALDLFRFDYRIECYTPAPKRKYGYFTLPILYNNALIGRLDPKAHRKEKVFEVKAIHLEPDVIIDDHLVNALRGAIQACADWHYTPQVVVRKTDPLPLLQALNFEPVKDFSSS
jgi:uncharacterized protein